MVSLKLDLEQLTPFVEPDDIRLFEREFALHREKIYQGTGEGADFLGWVDLPLAPNEQLLDQITADAGRIVRQSDVVVVVGIGGSYLGARAVIEAITGAFPAPEETGRKKRVEVLYAGHHLDEDYHHGLLRYLESKEVSVIVISKSGTTTEPGIAFRLLRRQMEERYGRDGAAKRIYAITDARRGALKKLADGEGYTSYIIPDDVGGRFSVLSPVGLLPIAVAGVNIRQLLAGAGRMATHLRDADKLMDNQAAIYAVVRNILYNKGKNIEVLTAYKPSLHYILEWWKQLYGESEGKDGKGIFPAGLSFTTDLHSMGQYIQDGLRQVFETVLLVDKPGHELIIPPQEEDLDGLNYLAGKGMDYVNNMAARGTMMAHVEGGVPNILIRLPALDEESLGELIYFFEMGCAFSAYILGVNPFDQPGVEAYKRNMFQLLGKPGN